MKTKQLTQRNEQQTQKAHTDSNLHLEDDEKILYSESVEDTRDTLVGIATTLFLIFGFPFYVIIGFTAITSFLTEKTWIEFGQEVTWPAGILLAVAGVSIVLALAFRIAYKATMGATGTKFLITNKRIYNYNPKSILPVMFESRYPDVLYIYPEKMGKHEYLNVRVKALEQSKDGPRIVETRHSFHVKNAKKTLMHVPDDVRWERSEKSKSGEVYKEKTKWETVRALSGFAVVVCFLAFAVITINIQVTVDDLLGGGNRLFKHGQYVQAERVYREAYKKISFFPAHADFGPAAYRYARALETNGKLNEAIPIYLQAAKNCNWTDAEEGITWKPAVFRSNVHIAEIYVKQNRDAEAEQYFDKALETALLETDENRVKSLFSSYLEFLNSRAKAGKAAMVDRLAGIFKISLTGLRTFRDWPKS